MGNHDRRGAPPQSKPQGPSGISAAVDLQLRERIEALEKLVREQFDEKNQWNSMVREWVGKSVRIALLLSKDHEENCILVGTLRWVDRYTMCLTDETNKPVIVHKAAIATIRPTFEVPSDP